VKFSGAQGRPPRLHANLQNMAWSTVVRRGISVQRRQPRFKRGGGTGSGLWWLAPPDRGMIERVRERRNASGHIPPTVSVAPSCASSSWPWCGPAQDVHPRPCHMRAAVTEWVGMSSVARQTIRRCLSGSDRRSRRRAARWSTCSWCRGSSPIPDVLATDIRRQLRG